MSDEQAPAQAGTEVAAPRPKGISTPIKAGSAIRGIIPTSLAEVAKLSSVLWDSGLAPYSFKNINAVAVAIMHGLEIGLPPMQALQSIAVIGGKPSIYGDGAKALILESGLCVQHKEWFTGNPYDDDFTAHLRLKRKGDSAAEDFEYSVADAKLARLWGKLTSKGEPTPWVTNPKRMMKWRARGFGYRDKFADVLRGLRLREEVQDDIPLDVEALPRPSIAARLPGPRADAAEPAETIEDIMGDANGNGHHEPDAASTEDEAAIEEVRQAVKAAKTHKELDVIASDFDATIQHMSSADASAFARSLISDKRDALTLKAQKEPQPKMV